mmetsp:Transcript_3145/g.12042  ORF Transcript_3145/g.12042 Transcript_3145/m.12042 type:complete len:533 (-) Transcript_3145:251-1849(-)
MTPSTPTFAQHPALPPFLASRDFSPILITRLLFTFWKHYSVGFLVNLSYSSYVVIVKALMHRRRRQQKNGKGEMSEMVKKGEALVADTQSSSSISSKDASTSTIQRVGKVSKSHISPASSSNHSNPITFLSHLYEIIKTKSWNNPSMQEKFLASWVSVKRIVRDSNNTGAFLGYWTILYFVLIRILHIRGVNRVPKTSLFVSSFLSGFVTQFVFVGVSWKIALYCLLRAFLGLTRMRKTGSPTSAVAVAVPKTFALSRLPVIGALLDKSTLAYVLINVGLGYYFYYWAKYVDTSYKNFISSLADVNLESVDKSIVAEWNMKETRPCQSYHLKFASCMDAFWHRNIRTLTKVLKIYSSVHLFGLLLSGELWRFTRGQSVAHKYAALLRHFTTGVFRSSLFLTMQIVICAPTPCVHNYICNKYNNGLHSRLVFLAPWIIGPFCIAFEHSSRRSEIALYSLWRLLIAMINKYTRIPSGENHSPMFERIFSALCFGLATSLWIVVKTRNVNFLKRLDRMILSQVFPPYLDLSSVGR